MSHYELVAKFKARSKRQHEHITALKKELKACQSELRYEKRERLWIDLQLRKRVLADLAKAKPYLSF